MLSIAVTHRFYLLTPNRIFIETLENEQDILSMSSFCQIAMVTRSCLLDKLSLICMRSFNQKPCICNLVLASWLCVYLINPIKQVHAVRGV